MHAGLFPPAKKPLHVAASAGDLKAIEAELDKGTLVDLPYDDTEMRFSTNFHEPSRSRVRKQTPLMLAAESGREEAVKLLVARGADIYARHTWDEPPVGVTGLSAFDLALKNEHYDIARYLWERSDKKRLSTKLSDHFAAKCWKYCNSYMPRQESARVMGHMVAMATDEEVLAAAIQYLASVEFAVQSVNYLLGMGVRIPKNSLPTQLSPNDPPRLEQLEAMRILLRNGADPDTIGPYNTALTGAIYAKQVEITALLLSSGASPMLAGPGGTTPILMAAGSCESWPEAAARQVKLIKLLLDAGAGRDKVGVAAAVSRRAAKCRGPATLPLHEEVDALLASVE